MTVKIEHGDDGSEDHRRSQAKGIGMTSLSDDGPLPSPPGAVPLALAFASN